MGYTSGMTTRRTRRAHTAAVLAGIALAAFPGCGSDPVQTSPYSPDLIAVTGPDSLPAGQPLVLKIHWFSTNTCQELSEFRFYQSNDSTYALVANGIERLGEACDDRANPAVEVIYQVPNPPGERFYVEVYGANQRFLLRVEGGTTPSAIERHRVNVRSVPPGQPANGAVVTFRDAGGTELGTATTGTDGTAELSLPCPAGGSRAYSADVLGEFGRRVLLPFNAGPARCGVPEVLHVNV